MQKEHDKAQKKQGRVEDDIITRFYVLGFTCYMERSIPV